MSIIGIERWLSGFGRFWLALAVLCLGATAASADPDPETFYRDGRLTLVVGYGPGGGYDSIARLVAPWLEQRLGADVVVENRPGGGGMVALNQLVDGEPDGRTVMLVNAAPAALAQLLEQDGVRFDLFDDFPWLGRYSADPAIVMAGPESGVDSLAGLKGLSDLRWAAGGKLDTIADNAACVSEVLGLNARIIIGYKGAKESGLALMRGEADAMVTSASTASKLQRNGLVPLAVVGNSRSELFPDVPTILEAVELTPEQAWWIDFREGVAMMGRSFGTTPGTPPERVAFLAAALESILTDPDFVAEATASGYVPDHLGAAGIAELAGQRLGGLGDERIARVRHVLLEKFYP